jgi:hypothetical protein
MCVLLTVSFYLTAQHGPYISDEKEYGAASEMKVEYPNHYCSMTIGKIDDLDPDNLPEGYNRPVVSQVSCGSAILQHTDEVQHIKGSQEVRIVRRWEVCDPCTNPSCGEGIQIIKARIDPSFKVEQKPKLEVPSNQFALHQNRPNPFSDQTSIGFTLPEAVSVQLTIHQVDGRVLHIVKGDYPEGFSEVIIEAGTLPLEGFLFYTLTTDKYKATKRMVKMD